MEVFAKLNYFTVSLIGAAVAQDAFAAAALYGSFDRTRKLRLAAVTAGCFSVFQMFMPLRGWSIGRVGAEAVGGIENVLAFGILSFLGIKMMLDSRKPMGINSSAFSLRALLLIALATSIDALTTGITLPAATGAKSTAEIITAVLMIGFITFCISFAGYLLGMKLSRLQPSAARLIGGAVLVCIGIKTLLFS